MSAKKRVTDIIEQTKTQLIDPSQIENIFVNPKCRKYLKNNIDQLAHLKLIYRHSIESIANQMITVNRYELEKYHFSK